MDGDVIKLIISVVFVVGMLVLAFTIGTLVERAHYKSIRARENELRNILVFPIRTPPAHMMDRRTAMVCGSVVIGMDYFKATLASLRNIVGGRVGSYETLFDRARREAVLRMKEEARGLNAEAVLNVKFSTANIHSGNKENKGFGCVEVIAYGTAVLPK